MIFDPQDERDELQLEALLGDAEERRRARAQLAREPGSAGELESLAHGLAGAAADLRRTDRPRAEARAVARILARTTRRPADGHAPGRPAARLPAVQVQRAAAALVLAFLAGTVLAAWFLREPAGRDTTGAETALDVARAPAPDETGEIALHVASLRRAAQASALARERLVLEQRGAHAPVVELGPDAAPEARLLAARSLTLRTRAAVAEPEQPLPTPPEPFGLALWAELELDRLVLTGAPSADLAPACLRLQDLARDPVLAARAPGTAALVRSAERRALGLGLLDGPAPESSPGPLSREWFTALEQAGRESGLGDAAPWKAWLARGPD